MKNVTLMAVALAVVTSAGLSVTAAEARQPGKGPKMSFEQLDANADGKVTQEELQAIGAARFAEADANGDGLLSSEEMMQARETAKERRIEKMIKRRDANGDGQLSLEEMAPKEGKDRRFGRLDANDDGAISKEEFDTAMAKRKDGGRHGKKHDKQN